MDPLKKEEQNNTEEVKEAVKEELNALTNPKPEDQNVNPLSFSSDSYGLKRSLDKKSESTERPIIRTYKTDTEEAIQSGHLSSISIAVSENKRMLSNMQREETPVDTKKKRISKSVIIISAVLVLCGILAVAVPYLLVQSEYKVPTNTEPISFSNIITTDLEEKVSVQSLSKTDPASSLKAKIDGSATSLSQVKDFLLTKGSGVEEKAITAQEFFDLIRAHVPSDIVRTLKPEFMLGMHNFSGNQKFLILKVGAYDATFSGMLAWEDDLWQDFKIIFDLPSENIVETEEATSSDAVSSSTKTSGTSTVSTDTRTPRDIQRIDVRKFQDAEFSNKDTRIVEDSSGKIVFLYSIIDENTVVITTNINTLKEIITRMSKARVITQ